MAETLVGVYTGDLINKKEISIKYALLMIDKRWVKFYLSFLCAKTNDKLRISSLNLS